MQDDFDGGAGVPDDELGGGPVDTGEPMGMPEMEGEGDAAPTGGRPSGGARRKSSGGARKPARKAARKSGGKKKAAKKSAKRKPARKAAKKSKKRVGSKK